MRDGGCAHSRPPGQTYLCSPQLVVVNYRYLDRNLVWQCYDFQLFLEQYSLNPASSCPETEPQETLNMTIGQSKKGQYLEEEEKNLTKSKAE